MREISYKNTWRRKEKKNKKERKKGKRDSIPEYLVSRRRLSEEKKDATQIRQLPYTLGYLMKEISLKRCSDEDDPVRPIDPHPQDRTNQSMSAPFSSTFIPFSVSIFSIIPGSSLKSLVNGIPYRSQTI